MECPVCSNDNVEAYKMRDGADDKARISCVGYHCHSCKRIGSALVETVSNKGVDTAFTLAYERFMRIDYE